MHFAWGSTAAIFLRRFLIWLSMDLSLTSLNSPPK